MADGGSVERLWLVPDGGGEPVELPQAGVLTIGAARGRVDLCLEGRRVGAVHCVVGRAKGGGFALKDLGAPAGTWLNGRPIQQARLQAGDELALGDRRLWVASSSAPAVANGATGATGAAPDALPAPRGYRLERRLGRGGMGSVYLAVQESLARPVALKVLDPARSADAAFVRRFQAEARAAAALSHPNVVTVYDVWEEQGRHWLSMEYMQRGSLEERVALRGPLSPAEALDVLIGAARGLEYAERRGIVHRDIKPANLMQDALGLTKIADLGLAVPADELGAGGARVFGTPHFISPEQARGEPVDVRSDLYSLGATAYRLLCGRTPFQGATTRDILRARFTETPRPLRELAPAVPAALEAVVLRLLAREPADRYQSSGALLAELETLRARGFATPAAPRPGRRALAFSALALLAALALWRLGLGGALDMAPARAGGPLAAAREAPEPEPEPEPAAEAPPAGPRPPGSGEAAAEDSDAALKALERDAAAAYAELPAHLAPDERAAELARLAAAFAGTTTARRIAEELARLPAGAAASPPAAPGSAELAALAAAAGDRAAPLHAALAAFAGVAVDPALALDPAFALARSEALRAALAARAAEAEARLAEVDRLAAEGRFDELPASLEALALWLDARGPSGVAPPPLAHAELERLEALRAAALARRAGLAEERERYRARREGAQARTLAAELFGDGPLARRIEALDLGAAAAELRSRAAELAPGPTADFAARLADELASGADALALLARSFAEEGWRRRAILDPRDEGGGSLSVAGVDARGLWIGEGAPEELVAWESFHARPDAIEQLFHQRLSREYSDAELDGIAFLMRLAAVERALGELRAVLDGRAELGELALDRLRAGLDVARPWCERAGDVEALEREQRALTLLVESLDAAGRGAWTLAALRAEWLLAEHAGTLLVRRLSDGTRLGASQAGAEAPAEPTARAVGGG